jgi:predicted permease
MGDAFPRYAGEMIGDLESGLRQFQRKPLFSTLVTLLLAVGIGSNVLIFGFIDTLLLKPLPVRDPENLWVLQSIRERQVMPNLSFSYGQFEELSKRSDIFSGITAEQELGAASAYPFGQGNRLGLVMTQILAPNYFKEMGVAALRGRVLEESDAKPSSNIPAVISYQFWQARYGGRGDILGRTIQIKNYTFTIVGVLPRDFHSVDIERAPDVRLPISAAPFLWGRTVDDPRGAEYREAFRVLARIRPGVNPAMIDQMAGTRLSKVLEGEFLLRNASLAKPEGPEALEAYLQWARECRLALEPIGRGISRLRAQFSQALKLLMSGVVVLLISVCANVAGLLLARGEERRKELAVRLSIGAGRWRLLRLLMTENLCLAMPGAGLGVILAYLSAPWVLRVLPPVRSLDQYASPQILTVTPDLRALIFAWLTLLVSICFFGLFPAWRASKLDLNAELRGTSEATPHSMAALLPVTVQVALSVLLLAAGGLMLRSYRNLQNLNPGFDRTHVFSFTLGVKDAALTAGQRREYRAELERQISEIPGVRSLAFSTDGLMRGAGTKTTITPQGVSQSRSVFLNSSFMAVTPKYFETLGIRLLAGKNFAWHDAGATPERILINQALANLLYPRANPIGKWLVQGNDGSKPPSYLVVGLVGTAKFRRMQEPAPPTFYALMADTDSRWVLYVRTAGNSLQLMRRVEDAIRKLGAGVPLVEAMPLEQEVQNSLWQERLVAMLASFFSAVALLLAGIGLYGTLAYAVARRRRELGIRIAVGAQAGNLLKTVCGGTSWAVVIGLGAGLGAGALALRMARNFLFEVDPLDKISFGAAALAVLASASLAALIPGWQALRTNAWAALREQ